MSASPVAVDFVTALSRLLRDGELRDAFAADRAAAVRSLGVSETDRSALERLAPADLEFQATVLLHKRFDLVKRALPSTCHALGDAAWVEFKSCARLQWPTGEQADADDALAFCRRLEASRTHAVLVCPREHARLRFRLSTRRVMMCFLPANRCGRNRFPEIGLWLRDNTGQPHEWLFRFGV